MKTYPCSKCNKKYGNLTDFKRHMNRKTDCSKPVESKCMLCNKIFNKSSNLTRHIQTIHRREKELENAENLKTFIETNTEQGMSIQDKFAMISNEKPEINNMGNNTMGNDNINCIKSNVIKGDNNIIFNINIFGKEGIDHIDPKEIEAAIKKSYGVIELIKLKHFNKEHLENFNFHLLTPTDRDYTMVKESNTGSGDWNAKKTGEFFNTLLINAISDITDIINVDELDKKYQDKIERLKDIVYGYVESDDDDNEKFKQTKKNKFRYKEFYEELIALSLRYYDVVIEKKEEDQKNLKDNLKKTEQIEMLNNEVVKRKPGRPKKSEVKN